MSSTLKFLGIIDNSSEEKPKKQKESNNTTNNTTEINWTLSDVDEINKNINKFYKSGRLSKEFLNTIHIIEYELCNNINNIMNYHYFKIKCKKKYICINFKYSYDNGIIYKTYLEINKQVTYVTVNINVIKNIIKIDKLDLRLSLDSLGFNSQSIYMCMENLINLFICLCLSNGIEIEFN